MGYPERRSARVQYITYAACLLRDGDSCLPVDAERNRHVVPVSWFVAVTMSASSSGSSTALRSHAGSNPCGCVASMVILILPSEAFSARLATAEKALKT